MLIVLSPAKTLDFTSPLPRIKPSEPAFLRKSRQAVRELRRMSADELAETLRISSKLAVLNMQRYQEWKTPFTPENARPAVLTFKGDVYQGLRAEEWTAQDLRYAQKHLRILSGLYGVLRPLDLMQAYRLEMGASFAPGKHDNLYEWWGNRITDALNDDLPKRRPVLLNLASSEYFKVIRPERLEARIITPVFKDYSNGRFKVLSMFTKQARGRMASWVIRNRIQSPDDLPTFDLGGYRYSVAESSEDKPVYLREGR